MTTRRSFLKNSVVGAGAFVLTPFNFGQTNVTAAGIPHRFIFIRKSNGNLPEQFALPTFSQSEQKKHDEKQAFEVDLDKHELPDWLKDLTPYKNRMTILNGISCEMSEGGHWSYSSPLGCFKSGKNSIGAIKRATVDFELAYLNPSPFTHVELALRGNGSSFKSGIISGFSAPGPHQRNYCYADPMTAYNELFKSVLNPGAVKSENLKLALIKEQESRKLNKLKGSEYTKISNYINSVNAIIERNNKVVKQNELIKKYIPSLANVHNNGGPAATTIEKQEGMTDILIATLQSGLSNVILYTIDELTTPITGLSGHESEEVDIHAVGHEVGYSGVSAKEMRNKIKKSHMLQIKKIIERLESTPEGNGNMFDNTTIIYMPETGAGHHQPTNEMPMIVMTGKRSKLDIAGRYIRLPFHAAEGHQTLGNWYTTLLNSYGNPIKHYGDLDLTMARKKLPQEGPIRRFMVSA